MSSKLEYLKRYEDRRVKKRKRKEEQSNFSVVDDDINWQSTEAINELENSDSDEAPLVAEVQDETVVKWQPLSIAAGVQYSQDPCDKLEDLSPPRRLSAPRNFLEDLSPPRRGMKDPEKNLPKSPPRRILDVSPPITKKKLYTGKCSSNTQEVTVNESDDLTGKFAETIYRHKKGVLPNRTKEEEDYMRQKDREFLQWGRG